MVILDSPTWHNFYLFYRSCMELMIFIQPFPVFSDLVSEILKAIQNWAWFGKNNTKASTQLWTPHFCRCYGVLHLLIHGMVPFPCPCRNVECSGVLRLPWPLMGQRGGGCHSTACPPSTHCPNPCTQWLYSPSSLGCWLSCSTTMLIWCHSWYISQAMICPSGSPEDAVAVLLSEGETCLSGFWQQPCLFERSI